MHYSKTVGTEGWKENCGSLNLGSARGSTGANSSPSVRRINSPLDLFLFALAFVHKLSSPTHSVHKRPGSIQSEKIWVKAGADISVVSIRCLLSCTLLIPVWSSSSMLLYVHWDRIRDGNPFFRTAASTFTQPLKLWPSVVQVQVQRCFTSTETIWRRGRRPLLSHSS